MSFQEFDTIEEAEAYAKQLKSKPYGRRVAESVYPGIQITDDVRPANSELGRKNPGSFHVKSDRAIDARAIPGMKFQDWIKGFNDAGYDVIQSIDEYNHPSANATGPHWHAVLGDKIPDGPKEFDTIEEAQAYADSLKKKAPAVTKPKRVNSPIDQNVPSVIRRQGSGTIEAGQTALTPAEEAQQNDIQNILFKNAKTHSWDDVKGAISQKYPDQFNAASSELKWYYDHYRNGGKTGINWQAAKDRKPADVTQGEEIVVNGQKKAPYEAELDYLGDRYKQATQHGFPGWAGRKIVGAMNPDLSEEDIAQAQKDLREELAAEVANSDMAGTVPGELAGIVPDMLGSAGPEYLVPGAVGETAAARLASAFGINAAADAAYQGLDIRDKVQDNFNPDQMMMSGLTGTVFQGAAEGLGRLAAKYGTEVKVEEDGTPYVDLPDTESGTIQRVYDPENPTSTKAQLLSSTARPQLQGRPRVELPTGDFRTKANVEAETAKISGGWKNAPEFNIVQKFDDLDEPTKLQIMRDTDGDPSMVKGWVGPDGKIHAIADHLETPEDISALTYHEALGHVGLGKLFGTRIDSVMEAMYRTNPELRDEVDAWFRDGGVVPETADSPTARATEEVLAERSESGPIDAATWDKLKNLIKAMGRKAGIKLAYTDREIRTILAMAHGQVINGGKPYIGSTGNRYIRVTHVSPHDFQNTSEEHPYGEFDHSKMGSGEGAQSYGWGTYLGENTRDAYYQKFDNQYNFVTPHTVSSQWIKENSPNFWDERKINSFIADVAQNPYREDWDGYLDYFNQRLENLNEILGERSLEDRPTLTIKRRIEETIAEKTFSEKIINSLPSKLSKPKTYEVEIHPHQVDRMMLWDKRLDQQPPKVQEAFKKLGFTIGDADEVDKLRAAWNDATDAVNFHYEDNLHPMLEKYLKEKDTAYDKAYKKAIDRGEDFPEARDAGHQAESVVTTRFNSNQEYKRLKAENNKLKLAEDQAEEAYRNARPMTAEQAYKVLSKKFSLAERSSGYPRKELHYETASKALLKEGVIGNKYEDGFSRGKDGGKSYNYVIFDEKEAKIINKYMMRKGKGPKASETPTREAVEEKASKFAEPGNINLSNLDDTNQISAVIRQAAKDIPRTKVSFDEIEAFAAENALSARDVKNFVDTNGGGTLLAMRNVLVQSGERVMKLVRKIDAGDNSDLMLESFARAMTSHRAIQESVSKRIADAGRTLNSLKIQARAGKSELEALKFMSKQAGSGAITSREGLEALAKAIVEHADSPAAQSKIMKDAFKPLPEDYLLSFRYNMMLYGLGTHVKNAMGNFGNLYTDSFEKGLAAIIGTLRRPLTNGNDRVSFHEVMARQQGILQALTSAGTWADAAQSFQEGRPKHQVSKVEVGHNLFSDALGPAGTAIDAPMKALAASDSFFRSLIENSSIFGLAHRQALKEGLKGEAYHNRVQELIANPTTEMQTAADFDAALLQLVDDPTWMGKALENLKARPKDTKNYGRRVARVGFHLIAPFARVTDRMLMAAIRRVPLVGFLDRVNQADWAAGGARRDNVVARMITGSAVISYFVAKAMADELSGNGPADYDKKAQMMAEGWQPNSILMDGKWVPLAGLDQIAPLASFSAAYSNALRDPDFKEQDILTKGLELIGTGANAVADNTFMEQIASFFAGFGNSPLAQNARENYAANMASSFVPATVRQASDIADGKVRDASANGEMGPKIVDRLKSNLPGLREELPIRHDVYGREIDSVKNILGIGQSRAKDTNPVVVEIARLTKDANEGKALVTPVDRGDLSKTLGIKKIPSEIVQEYQRVSGTYVLDDLTAEIKSPEWSTYNDDERIAVVKRIVKNAREDARADLFESTGE